MNNAVKPGLKALLGELPLTAETYWLLRRQGKPVGGLNFKELQSWLPAWRKTAAESPARKHGGKRIYLFATLGYWIQHAALLSMSLAAQGHQVTLGFLPYANWSKRTGRFNLRLQNVYARSVLSAAAPVIEIAPWYEPRSAADGLPAELQQSVKRTAEFDVMYTDQIEAVDPHSPLFSLRLERNQQAARKALEAFNSARPDLVILPNGSILEFGAVFQAAHYLNIPVVTYEFGEQRDRIWFAADAEVMRQDTDQLWQVFQDQPLDQASWQRIRELFASRQKASLWENFSRRWQAVPSQGSAQVREALGLDERPIVLLPANVIGDSLTLGRQVFSDSMTQWLTGTVEFFSQRQDTQLVVRIHPGERYTQGPSVQQVIQQALPELPENIRLVPFDAAVNTYDLIQIADLGLVYTTTVGLEMAMSGVPVITAGVTHYRQRGFTFDPPSWQAYEDTLGGLLAQPEIAPLSRTQVEQAWNYAYRFFFEFPMPFPWHVLYMPDDVAEWPLERVLSAEGQALYGDTFRCLTGEPRRWQREPLASAQEGA